MKLAVRLLVTGMFLVLPHVASGTTFDGNALLQKCGPFEKLYEDPASMSNQEASGVIYCLGYIDGFLELFVFQAQSKIVPTTPYCLPDMEIPPKKDIARAIIKYLKDHPENLEKNAPYNIFMALREAYPCGQPEPGKEKSSTEVTTEK